MHTNTFNPFTGTGYDAETAAQIERKLIRQEFEKQPPKVQAETIERILALLVAEYRRRPNVHSWLWKNMALYSFTENLVRLTAERT